MLTSERRHRCTDLLEVWLQRLPWHGVAPHGCPPKPVHVRPGGLLDFKISKQGKAETQTTNPTKKKRHWDRPPQAVDEMRMAPGSEA